MLNRVLMIFAISLIAGIVLPHNTFVYIFIFSLLVFLYFVFLIKLKRHFILTIIIGTLAGILISEFAPCYTDGKISNFSEQQVECTMVVRGVPIVTEKYTKFEAVVEEINGNQTNEKVLVYVYDAKNIDINSRLIFNKIKFKLPSDKRNPGGFDYRKYLTGKGIFFTATSNVENIISTMPCKSNVVSYASEINKYLSNVIDQKFTMENGGIFKAVLLGNKNDIDDDTLGSFRDSGLSHIMAVSGLHLAIIVMLINSVTRYFNRWIKFAVSFVFITAFVFITGMPVSVIRAAIMLLMLQLTDAMFLESDPLTNLSLAALIVLIPNPNAVYDIGFVMSFSATLGILCLNEKLKQVMPKSIPTSITESICVTLSAQIATLPFSALYFGQLSLLATVSNLLIVVLMPLIYIFGIPAIFINWKPVLWVSECLVSLLAKWAAFCSNLPGQMQYIPINTIVILGLFLFTATALISSAIKNKKFVAWLLTISVSISFIGGFLEIKPVNGTEVTFLNVGQADCAMVRTADTVFLVDTATEYMGESEISGYLLRKGLSQLDGIFISHFDTDHCGGLFKILDRITVSAIYVPDTYDVGIELYRLIKYADENKIRIITLKNGDKVKFSDVDVTVLHPLTSTVKYVDNDTSLVFRVDNKDMSVLFMGDLQKDALIENCDTDILKVSHHGSKNGTSDEFLKKNTPRISVISLAENNSYGFPHKELMERLTKYSDKIYRTDLNKTITVSCTDKKYSIETMK